jgi:L-alanine-DL-glutamate epimerase-like enolase superfamily enzyme
MILTWQIVRFNLKETFSIAYGNYNHRDALLIELKHKGFTGYGECTAIDYYKINLLDYSKILATIKERIEAQEIVHPTTFYPFLETFNLPSFLRSALDCAYWDLFGKLENKSFLDLNSIDVKKIPNSSLTISIAPVSEQLKKMEQSLWSKFKVKCSNLDQEKVRLLLSTEYSVALDANGSFSKSDCDWLENYEASRALTYVEQPMSPGIHNFSSLDQSKNCNWMADEDCQKMDDLLILKPHYTSVNIKLVKCGGLTPALQIIKKAKELGFKIMIGCMTESTIGISAGIALAPLVDYADLDGAHLIANDIAYGSHVVNGEVIVSNKPGLGISLRK